MEQKHIFARQPLNLLLFIIPLAVFLVHGFWLYGSAGRDDVHITYAEALNLANGHGFSNINGDKVEQGSSILHVALLGGVQILLPSIGMPTLGAGVSILSGALVLCLMMLPNAVSNQRAGQIAALATAINPYFTYWAFGGLESVLAGLIVLSAFLLLLNRMKLAIFAATLSLYVLVRPEGFFVILLFSMATLAISLFPLARKGPLDQHLARLGIFALAFGLLSFLAVTAFRIHYFGRAFPLPVYAKSAGISLSAFAEGFSYLLLSMLDNLGFMALGLIVLFCTVRAALTIAPKKNPAALVAGLFALSILSFIVAAGGDWMEGGRFLIPAIPLLTYFGCLAMGAGKNRWSTPLILILCGIMAFQANSFSLNRSTGRAVPPVDLVGRYSWFELQNQVHLRDAMFIEGVRKIVDAEIKRKGKIVILSGQAGMVLFYLRQEFGDRIRFLDIRALATDDFLRCPLTLEFPKSKFGLLYEYTNYLDMHAALEEKCAIPMPDLIFELGDENQDRLNSIVSHGYRVAYKMEGRVPAISSLQISMDQILFVRTF